ncbi:MAG: HD domain-containing protein [Gorillibacterium sp.]|nr:HD domain-containing protein [Gorillibacterium sp.]
MIKHTATRKNKFHVFAEKFCLDNQQTQFLLKRMRTHDKYIYEHSLRTAYYSMLLAKGIGLPTKEQGLIYRSALLMDIGKLQTAGTKYLGNEEDSQSEARFSVLQHPVYSAKLLERMAESGLVDGEAILQHHENLDGTGYPHGLVWEDIVLNARIIRVADSFTTMTTVDARTGVLSEVDLALSELYCWSDIQYDSDLVTVMCHSYGPLGKKKKPRDDKGTIRLFNT